MPPITDALLFEPNSSACFSRSWLTVTSFTAIQNKLTKINKSYLYLGRTGNLRITTNALVPFTNNMKLFPFLICFLNSPHFFWSSVVDADHNVSLTAGSQPHHCLQPARLLLPVLRPHLAAPLRQPEGGVCSRQPLRRRAHQLPGARLRQGPRHR